MSLGGQSGQVECKTRWLEGEIRWPQANGLVIWLIQTELMWVRDRDWNQDQLWLISTAGLGFQTLWLHSIMQNAFPLHGIRLGSLSQMVTVPVLGTDLHPNYIHFNQGIRVQIRTTGKILQSTGIRVRVRIRVRQRK